MRDGDLYCIAKNRSESLVMEGAFEYVRISSLLQLTPALRDTSPQRDMLLVRKFDV